MTFLEAALEILRRERKPLHYKDITTQAMDKKLLTFVGRTPEVTMQTQLTAAVKKTPGNPFVRVKPGTFGLLRYPDAPVVVPEEVPAPAPAKAAPAAARAAKTEEGATSSDDRARRRRRGGRGRTRRDEPGDTAVTGSRTPAAVAARGRSSDDTGPDDDDNATGEGPDEPEIGSMSAEDRAAALAESGVLSALDDDGDDNEADGEGEGDDEAGEDRGRVPPRSAGQAEPEPQGDDVDDDIEDSDDDEEDDEDDGDEDEDDEEEEEEEEALPGHSTPASAPSAGLASSTSDRSRSARAAGNNDADGGDELEAGAGLGRAPRPAAGGSGEFAVEGGASLSAQPGAGGFEDSAGGRRRRRRRRRRGGGVGTEGFGEAGGDESAPRAHRSEGNGDSNGSGNGETDVNTVSGTAASGSEVSGLPAGESQDAGANRRIMSPVDAAIEILRGQAPGRGMHVRQLADAATRRRLVHGEANEAWRVMRAALAAEPRERLRAGQRPRIRSAGSGLFALSRRPPDLDLERAEHVFGEARRALRERTLAGLEQRMVELAPSGFEAIARVLLQREGFGPATFVKRVEGTVYLEALRGRGIKPSRCLIALRPGGIAAGRRAVGELRAGIRARNQDEGVLLLGARLAEDGIAEWRQPGPPIEVADGAALAETCLRHGVGVINTMVSVDFVDADFFAEMQEG